MHQLNGNKVILDIYQNESKVDNLKETNGMNWNYGKPNILNYSNCYSKWNLHHYHGMILYQKFFFGFEFS